MRFSHAPLSIAIAATLAMPSLAFATTPTNDSTLAAASAGTLIGQVKEGAQGVFLDGAVITIAGRQAYTDNTGHFRIQGLPAGEHTLTVDYLGYTRESRQITISESAPTRTDIILHDTKTDATLLDRVVVRGQREAQAIALNQQRASTNYMNVVSSDLLGQFPDNNIAESTQRIPGVSIERDQGEGRYVTVRGAPKQYTTVSLDGVPLANPDGSSRGVELDTIPSDVIAALEVTKAITPDMDGDAIGGNINIRTQSALDRDGPTLRASTALGKFQLGDGDNQRHNATAGQRFGADNNIGVLFSGSYSKQGRFTDNVESLYTPVAAGFAPSEIQIKDYEGTRTRRGLTGRFDFRINADNLVYFVASDANFKDHEFRDNLIITLDNYAAGSNETTGQARATFDKELRERTYDKSIRTYNLAGEHFIGDNWKLDWQASQSKATKTTSPRMQYIFRSTVRPQMKYDYANPDFPTWAIQGRPDAPATGVNLPESWFGFRRLNNRHEYNEETETALRFDAQRQQNFLGDSGTIKLGLRSRSRDKLFDDERYRNSSATDFKALGVSMADMLCSDVSNNFDYFLAGRKFCRDIFSKYAGPLLSSSNMQRLLADSVTGDYQASEDIRAGYARLDANWDKLALIAGVRYEHTKLAGSAVKFNQDTQKITPQHASRSYGNVLPSVHMRYEFSADSILRASYSTGLNRPDFMYTAPYRVAGESETSDVAEGNPNAKAAYAHSLDLSFEHYLRPLGLLSAALFYKRINDPLFVASHDEPVVVAGSNLTRKVTRAENGDGGSIHGAELTWQQTFDKLPGALDGLGVYANYTYAKSSASLPFGLGKTELPGTSRSNYNFALTYEKFGLNTRLAYNYRSKFIQSFDISNPALNVYWGDRASLDFTASYAINKQWRLFTEVNNITNTRQVRFQGARNRVLEMEGFGRSWLAGVSFKL